MFYGLLIRVSSAAVIYQESLQFSFIAQFHFDTLAAIKWVVVVKFSKIHSLRPLT